MRDPSPESSHASAGQAHADARLPLRYRFAGLLLAPAFIAHAVFRAARDGGFAYLRGRLGYMDYRSASQPVWIHCASVGEVITAAPLLKALESNEVSPLVVTTSTPTGHVIARKRLRPSVHVHYLPIDRPSAIRRFLRRLRPRAALILETELWPHLFAELRRLRIPIALVNARLTQRSLRAPRWWGPVARFCLECVTVVLARSAEDASRFRELGAPSPRIHVIGNLKLAAPSVETEAGPMDLKRPFVLVASTHDDEERQIATAWDRLGLRDHLLVIAPRHPERGGNIARTLVANGYDVARRSQGDCISATTEIYLADTMGELPALMAASELVIMGGSLVPHGGHNVLEAARAERAVITGPHTDNFHDECAALERAGALARGQDATDVVGIARDLLSDPERRRAMGYRAGELLEAAGTITDDYMASLRIHIPAMTAATD
ncbi:MAG: 3-deoxy-D-manno-octulosonic acid transferase [Halofilum sp. (in: g-proteobacteria)]|nr:3-deoxy-D-manno-octulosonic acid transferase [Halofilum sp. (in: g-proteobacteria)]